MAPACAGSTAGRLALRFTASGDYGRGGEVMGAARLGMARLVAWALTPGYGRRLLLIALLGLGLAGCQGRLAHESIVSKSSGPQAGELLQTDVDRMATLAMRDNLRSLYQLMSKLYQRNPQEWQKTGLADRAAAERVIHQAIEQNRPLPQLGGRRDVAALDYALSPEFKGDRVGAFIFALGSMLVTAHGGRTEFYITDTFNAEFIYNAARNTEKAAWMLGQRRDAKGRPLLLSNEGGNLSFAVEFGKMVARLDLLTHVLEERYRRLGVNYAQSLLFMNFLPVQ